MLNARREKQKFCFEAARSELIKRQKVVQAIQRETAIAKRVSVPAEQSSRDGCAAAKKLAVRYLLPEVNYFLVSWFRYIYIIEFVLE